MFRHLLYLTERVFVAGFNCDIDVHSTVRLARAQRSGMVQNKQQYRFIYLALQDYMDNKNLRVKKKVMFIQSVKKKT